MPHHCTEAAHFFICVYVILLGLSSIYLSVGFPCNPWADLIWDKARGGVSEFGHAGKTRGCWRDCQAYALRLHIIRHPDILDGNPRVSLVHSLLSPIQPNPFCYTSSHLLPDLSGNPFCHGHGSSVMNPPNATPMLTITGKEFRHKKLENGRLHAYVLVALCLDCIVVSLSILLIYIAALPQSHPYGLTFLVTLFSHILSLFLSSYVAKWLNCSQPETNSRFCDAAEDIKSPFSNLRVHLPGKASGVSNFEISLVIKNVNLVCLVFGGLCYFSTRRSFEGGPGRGVGGEVIPVGPPRDGGAAAEGVRANGHGQGGADEEADSPVEGD